MDPEEVEVKNADRRKWVIGAALARATISQNSILARSDAQIGTSLAIFKKTGSTVKITESESSRSTSVHIGLL